MANSRGVPHILEHSVLCGSRKYPIKEPFVELMKGSLNTFLNAFTYPDRTCYPVRSQRQLRCGAMSWGVFAHYSPPCGRPTASHPFLWSCRLQVASTNLQDFYNLVDVYLDAVLHPRCVEDPQIFAQEGWHYELDDKEVCVCTEALKAEGATRHTSPVFGSNAEAALPDSVAEFKATLCWPACPIRRARWCTRALCSTR